MITPIQVQPVDGPLANRWLRFDEPPITFGRSGDNSIVVDLAHASRQHGRFQADGDQWVVVCQSSNGLEIDGKRIGPDQQRALKGESTLSVGGKPILHVRIGEAEALDEPAPAGEPARKTPDQKSGSPRTGLWVGIAVWMALVLGAGIWLATLEQSEDAGPTHAPELTQEQISDVIRKPPPDKPTDERAAGEALQQATEFYQRSDSRIDGLYQAWLKYRDALAFSAEPMFEEGLDQRRYHDVEQRLVEGVVERYRHAYTLLRSQRYRAALEAFDQLLDFFPHHDSIIYKNAQEQQRIARTRLEKQG